MLTPSDFKIVLAWRPRRDSGAGVIQKQRMPVWEAKRQAVQSQLERERSEPPGQVLHEAVLRAMLPGLEGLEGVGPKKAKQLMQARVNQSCSEFWPGSHPRHVLDSPDAILPESSVSLSVGSVFPSAHFPKSTPREVRESHSGNAS